MAKKNGCRVIAITDHDTISGVEEAITTGVTLGVRVIPGIELSVEDHHIHILGLGIDTAYPPLLAMTQNLIVSRLARAQEMVKRFHEDGFLITWEDVTREAKGPVIARPHIVDAILKHPENIQKIGGPMTKNEFFRTYLYDTSKYYVHHSNISAKDAIRLIHDAGGIAIWSHPPIPAFQGNCAGLESFLKELLEWGLDGIEALGPSLTAGDTKCLDELSKRYSLLRTAGSDFHEQSDPGDTPWPRSAATIGEFPTYGYSTEGVVEAVDEAIAARHAERHH